MQMATMKKRTVLLINPPVYDFAAFDLWAKPLGQLYLSSILKENDINVQMLDYMDRHFGKNESKSNKYGCGHYIKNKTPKPEVLESIPRYYSRYGISADEAKNYLKNISSPDIVMITSVMTYWYPGVFEAVATVKEIFPEVKTVLGGVYATLCPEHAQKTGADLIVKGELAALKETFFSMGWNIEIPKNFSDFPSPDFSHYKTNEYACLRMSLGCPFRCSYCAQDLLCGNSHMVKPWQKVFDEIKFFTRKGIKNIAFYDDALLYKAEENIKPLLSKIIDENLDINIHTPNGLHARYLDAELASLMKKSGFIMPRFSLETVNSEVQKKTGNKVSADIFAAAAECLQSAGYKRGEYTAYLLIGMPGQSLEDAEKSAIFVNSLGAKISFSEYSVIPGTKDFLKADEKFASEPLYHNKSVFPLFSLNQWSEIRRIKELAIKLNSLL
jgi:Fe-S oxidoreductase